MIREAARCCSLKPGFSGFTDVVQVGEHPGVEHADTVAAVESLDEAVLARLARLDASDCHSVSGTPGAEQGARKLRTVIDTETLGACTHARRIRISAFIAGLARAKPRRS